MADTSVIYSVFPLFAAVIQAIICLISGRKVKQAKNIYAGRAKLFIRNRRKLCAEIGLITQQFIDTCRHETENCKLYKNDRTDFEPFKVCLLYMLVKDNT